MALNSDNDRIWKNVDVLLYLRNFMDDKKLVLLAKSCRFIHQIITGQSYIWKRRYMQNYCLGDKRKQEWLLWFIWCTNTTANASMLTPSINIKKQKRSLLSKTTTINNSDDEATLSVNDCLLTPGFDTVKWYCAFQRRKQTSYDLMASRFNERSYQLPVDERAELGIVSTNPWNTLVYDNRTPKIWLIYHVVREEEREHDSEAIIGEELISTLALHDSTPCVDSIHGTSRFVVASISLMVCGDAKPIYIGDPVVEWPKAEVQRDTENESAEAVALATFAFFEKLKFGTRTAIIVWLLIIAHLQTLSIVLAVFKKENAQHFGQN
ncbi:hypothetical protein BDF19DRAFT_496827 [Syncephalis fuscata]|nr:hypothetical protein BDF19DRAFT_496827 [Syncephalis fuscata]